MNRKNLRLVVKDPDGGWNVKAPGATRASAHTETQDEAERTAKRIVANLGGGEVRIQGRQRKFLDSDTVKPGRDPNPPRDTKH